MLFDRKKFWVKISCKDKDMCIMRSVLDYYRDGSGETYFIDGDYKPDETMVYFKVRPNEVAIEACRQTLKRLKEYHVIEIHHGL